MTFPPRVVFTLLAAIVLIALAGAGILHLRHRHNLLASLVAFGALLATGWVVFVLPAYWD